MMQLGRATCQGVQMNLVRERVDKKREMLVHMIIRPQVVRADILRGGDGLSEFGRRLEVEHALPYDVEPLQ